MSNGGDLHARYASVCKRTRRVAACIPADRLESPPGAGRFSSGDIVRHIAATERWMWGENALLRPSRYPGHGPELASGKDEVLEYLRAMQDQTSDIIAGLSASDLERVCTTVGGAEIRVCRWLDLMLEHQVHHRGQLYQLLAGLGVETPPLYGLTEAQVRARSVTSGARDRKFKPLTVRKAR